MPFGQTQIKKICHEKGLESFEPRSSAVHKIDSVNSKSFRKRLIELDPSKMQQLENWKPEASVAILLFGIV